MERIICALRWHSMKSGSANAGVAWQRDFKPNPVAGTASPGWDQGKWMSQATYLNFFPYWPAIKPTLRVRAPQVPDMIGLLMCLWDLAHGVRIQIAYPCRLWLTADVRPLCSGKVAGFV